MFLASHNIGTEFSVFAMKNTSVCLFPGSVKRRHDLLINCEVIVTVLQYQDVIKCHINDASGSMNEGQSLKQTSPVFY